jgi:hypothetical protein
MAPANHYFNTGGMDGSLQYELTSTENLGPGLGTTLQFMGEYLSRTTTIADLLAAGVYASVRSCGGPIVPLRTGRKDATAAGDPGVPQPQNSIGIFTNQFDRMGFSVAEMIQVTACGHTLGGVHKAEFPDIVPNAPANGEVTLDTTVATFDNKIVTEWLDGTTKDPLAVGPSVAIQKHSDFKVFNADRNVTMRAMADAAAFANTCKTVLQKMIDVVPGTTTLSAAPLTPYVVKPVKMQLTLQASGASLLLTGAIRVHTTTIPSASIASVSLIYKDRNGGNNCGACTVTGTLDGSGSGFDDTFDFFAVSGTVSATSGISSFTIKVNKKDGSSQTFDNNGNSYPMSDAIMLQTPQSCLTTSSGALTVTAAVRNDRATLPVNLLVSYPATRNLVTPSLNSATVAMTKSVCAGEYTLFTTTYSIPGGLSSRSRLDVTSGSGAGAASDSYKAASDLGATCGTLVGGTACGGASSTTSATSTSSTSSASATPTGPSQPATVGTWNWYGCQTEATGARALSGKSFAADTMTLESCASFCAGFNYFGVEYARECYCGNSFNTGSVPAPASECSFTCKGAPQQFCGAGNRLSVYTIGAAQSSSTSSTTSRSSTSSSSSTSSTRTSTTTTTSSTTSSQPTSTTLGRVQNVGPYGYQGCWTEGNGVRALSGKATASDTMSLDACATFCADFAYFGTEYGRECECPLCDDWGWCFPLTES